MIRATGIVCRTIATAAVALFAIAGSAQAQAWVPPARMGAVTFLVQTIDNSGHLLDDGSLLPNGKSTTVAVAVDVDYAFTDRLSITVGVPYVFAKYRGPGGPPPGIPFEPVDSCFCWHGGLQDFGFTGRYNLVNHDGAFVITPSLAIGVPSHRYGYIGEAVVGRRLHEARLGIAVGRRMDAISSRLSIDGRYSYAFVERVLGLLNNRNNFSIGAAFAGTRRLSVRGSISWQRTHGGLRLPSEVIGFPDRVREHDRLLKDNYVHLGGGVAYTRSDWDVSASYIEYASGTNSHAGRVFTVSLGRVFEVGGGL